MSYSQFVEEIKHFKPYHDHRDLCWAFVLREKRKWVRVFIQKYQEDYYVSSSNRVSFTYPNELPGSEIEVRVENWTAQILNIRKQLEQDSMAARSRLLSAIPMELRNGLISRADLITLIPDWMRIDQELTPSEKAEMIEICRESDPKALESITTGQYFEYCRLAYNANPATFENGWREKTIFPVGLTGKEYYERYADGRHGGLLEIDESDSEAFANWLTAGGSGGHPWEIYRGGNSTHINLSVSKAEYGQGFQVSLVAFSSTRLVETCRIAIALRRAGLPFKLCHKESYLSRILVEDWVGIVPELLQIKYGWQNFPKEYGVSDCVILDWIWESCPKKKRAAVRRLVKKLVNWMPERLTLKLILDERPVKVNHENGF